MPPRFQRFVRTEGILDRVWCTLVIIPVILRRHEFLQSGMCGWGPIYGLFHNEKKKNGGCHLDELIRDVQVGLGVDYFVV